MSSRAATRLLATMLASIVVVSIALIWSLSALAPSTTGNQVGLERAVGAARAREVERATFLDHDKRVVLDLTTSDAPVWASYPAAGSEANGLVATLVEGGAEVRVDQQWAKQRLRLIAEFILPLLLLAALFGTIIVVARGGSGQVRELLAFSRLAARRTRPDEVPARFTDLGGASASVTELADVRDYLKEPRRFAAMGAVPPRGVLLYGPPGCGKTLVARALAGEAGVPFYFLSGSEFVESLVGVGAARMRDLFRQAMANAPAIVFIDELDAVGRKRGAGIGGGHDEREQTLNELLVQMDGFTPDRGVVVIAATNRPDILDPALLRPGRFDRHVGIDPPDLQGRLEILRIHAKTKRLADPAHLETVARGTPGFSGADLANVLNEASLLAVRRRATVVTLEDLLEAVDRVVAGPRRQGRLLTPGELWRLANHEAGHAVVTSLVDYPAELRRVSIVARGRDAAHAAVVRSDRTVLTRDDLLAELTITMAGLAAEELVTGQPSTAVEGDLERATELARDIVGRFGMSEGVGRMRIAAKDAEVFLGRDYVTAQQIATGTREALDTAVRTLLAGAEQRARTLLADQRETLDHVATALVERETLDAAQLEALLTPRPSPPTTRRTRRA